MVEQVGLDLGAVREGQGLAGLETVMLEMRRQMVETDRKERRGVEPVEGRLGALAAKIAAEGADDTIVAEEGGFEERQAADVIEMEMAEQNIDSFGCGIAQMRAQRRKARSRIDDEKSLAAAHLNTGSMTTEFYELRTGRTGRTSHSPESDLEVTRR